MKYIERIYEQYLNGDNITDTDLFNAISHFSKTHDCLNELGPTFKLATNECSRILYNLEGYRNARNIKWQ